MALFGIALSRQGDLLVFENGSLLFSYRYGRWQYWNHKYLVGILSSLARSQRVSPKFVGTLVRSMYKAALDLSFRRSGGLLVLLKNRHNLDGLVPLGDAVGAAQRDAIDRSFDAFVEGQDFQSIHRSVIVELASIDGAVVLNNQGEIRAYGSILQPHRIGKLRGTEGARTRAAIGASFSGLAIKISSDGDITAYHQGQRFIRI
jgi:DNA integrity scanning protein DisA with diadenylate cyclase activity